MWGQSPAVTPGDARARGCEAPGSPPAPPQSQGLPVNGRHKFPAPASVLFPRGDDPRGGRAAPPSAGRGPPRGPAAASRPVATRPAPHVAERPPPCCRPGPGPARASREQRADGRTDGRARAGAVARAPTWCERRRRRRGGRGQRGGRVGNVDGRRFRLVRLAGGSRPAGRRLSRGQHTQRSQQGGRPERPAGERGHGPRHRRSGDSWQHTTRRPSLWPPAAPPPRLRPPAGTRWGHVSGRGRGGAARRGRYQLESYGGGRQRRPEGTARTPSPSGTLLQDKK